MHVVRGGKRLLNTRHHLDSRPAHRGRVARSGGRRSAGSSPPTASPASGSATRRSASPPTARSASSCPPRSPHLANAPHGRYVLACPGRVRAPGRGVGRPGRRRTGPSPTASTYDTGRGRWYLTASWQHPVAQTIPLDAARANGVIGVDTNADHLAAYRLDTHGNPIGEPAPLLLRPVRHRRSPRRPGPARPHPPPALGQACGVNAIARRGPRLHRREDPREARPQEAVPAADLRHAHRQAPRPAGLDGRRDRHRRSSPSTRPTPAAGAPSTGRSPSPPRPARPPATMPLAWRSGRRALGHPIRRRTAPPPHDQSDRAGHRTVQAGPGARGREGTRPRIPGPRTRSVPPDAERTRGTSASKTVRDARSSASWVQDSLLLTDEERFTPMAPGATL